MCVLYASEVPPPPPPLLPSKNYRGKGVRERKALK
jgi:hypothetical protein